MELTRHKGLGAKLSPVDNRTIPTRAVQPKASDRPKKYMFDDSKIPVQDQGDIGTCVGEAEGSEVEARELKDTGKLTEVAHLDLYGECKLIDGIPNEEGTYPIVAAGIKVKKGVVSAKLRPDDRDLSHAEIIARAKKKKTQEEADDASLRVAKGYTEPRLTLDDLLDAIYQNGTFCVTVDVGKWDKLPVKPMPNRGRHRIRLKGYDMLPNGDAMIWFRNSWGKSWGKNGDGYFLWSDYQLNIYEPLIFQDVPLELILKARSTPYLFTRTLKYGMRGPDVAELQKRLAKELDKDGLPCYRYEQNGELYISQYFGRETEKALQRYQCKVGIACAGTPETTGYGQLGPKTRAALAGQPPRPELYPAVRQKRDQLMRIMKAFGRPIVVTGEYRTNTEQDALYAQGRTTPGLIVTNAKGGESMHNYRVAFDIAFSTDKGLSYDGDWNAVAEVGKTLGLEWGGDWQTFPDRPHFQFTAGHTLKDFQEGRIDEGKFAVQ